MVSELQNLHAKKSASNSDQRTVEIEEIVIEQK